MTNYTAADIPLKIGGLSTGTTTVNTVDPANWQTLKKPALGDNYILSKKNTDSPAQDVFVLGNAECRRRRLVPQAHGRCRRYGRLLYVAGGQRCPCHFDKNGGDTEASPRLCRRRRLQAVQTILTCRRPIRPVPATCSMAGTPADGAGAVFTAETDVTDNMTVYAQWKPDEAYAVKSHR